MSADNYWLIKRHPHGGYAAVMGFVSDKHSDLTVDPERHRSFPTVSKAVEWTREQGRQGNWTEYGTVYDDETFLASLDEA